MGEKNLKPEQHTPKTMREKPCWRELLVAAMAGLYPTDEHLEQMLDHLERMP